MAVVRNQVFRRAGTPFTPKQLTRLHDAALAACDGRDGLVDGIITDPRLCEFDPGALQCGGDRREENCLTPKQVRSLRTMYTGVKTSAGETVAYPLYRGSEGSWSRFISVLEIPTDEEFNTGPTSAGLAGLRTLLLNNANFPLARFDPNKHYRTVRDSAFAADYEAKDPDISAFLNAGGKLLLWHGFFDPGPSALATIEYFAQVKRVTGAKVDSLESGARLFVLPGVYHCRGGPGADEFNAVAAMDAWVEHGTPPTSLIATRKDGALSRPVCEYPTLPRYKGSGDPSSAASFICK
jgi:Tannase and feruloyl esterase